MKLIKILSALILITLSCCSVIKSSDVAKTQDSKAQQIKTTTKLLRVPTDKVSEETAKLLENGEHLTDDKVLAMMRELSTINNAEIMTMPTIISRSGASANIEIFRELVLAENKSDNWVGLKFKIDSNYSGMKLITNFNLERRQMEGMDSLGPTDIEGLKYDESTVIQTHKTPSKKIKIDSGMTKVIKLNSPANSNGTADYMLITQTIIDATGQKVDPAKSQE